jgi:hypothetical protein
MAGFALEGAGEGAFHTKEFQAKSVAGMAAALS